MLLLLSSNWNPPDYQQVDAQAELLPNTRPAPVNKIEVSESVNICKSQTEFGWSITCDALFPDEF
jgi:hypothetical protein